MKHADLLARLTLEEKCRLLSGRDFWNTVGIQAKGVPSVCLSDGPHGVRRQAGASDQLGIGASLPATCFPTAAAVACSWDPALAEAIGEALGEEAAGQGVGVLLGPGLNIKRSPLCGRNFEYFSEDPLLSGRMAAGYVRGIQKNGISACLKHFAANNAELRRQASDSVVDERTLREIYLTGFEIAVLESAPKCVMAAYNRVNGVYANENAHLLKHILREEWGFDGFVVSDWGAGNDFVEGVRAGSNLEMPSTGGDSPEQLMAAVAEGRIDEAEIDARVDELLGVVLPVSAAVERRAGKGFDEQAHHALARRACEESAVLLKNEDGMLPLRSGTRVAVIGDFARNPRYQGAGSSMVNATLADSLLDAMKGGPLALVGYARGCPRTGPGDAALRSEAAKLASRADVAIVYVGLDEISESEGLDRRHMRLPDSQVELLEAVSAANPNVVALLAAGTPVEMPWIERCRALLYGGLCGQAGAGALLDIVCGRVNPSGKLAESYPMADGDCPCAAYSSPDGRQAEYREGLYVGYRYYETVDAKVRFPFGHGLSYTAFEYSDLALSPGGASFTLTNTGKLAGAEIAQLYVCAKSPRAFRPAKELKGFAKVPLAPGGSRRVTIPFDRYSFRWFNTRTDRFEVDDGEYGILIGASASDIRLSGALHVAGTGSPLPEGMDALPDYASGRVAAVPDAEFERLLGHPIPQDAPPETLGINDTISDMRRAKSLKARLLWRLLAARMEWNARRGRLSLPLIYIYNTPFRGIGKTSGGYVSQQMCESLLTIINGHGLSFFKGMGGLAAGFFRQWKARRRAARLR